MDLESLNIKYKKRLPSAIPIIKIELKPIVDSDNIVILINKKYFYYLLLSLKSDEPILIEKNLNNCVYLLVESSNLALVDQTIENKEEITIWKFNDITLKLIFKEIFSHINHIKYLNMTPDCQYLSIFSEKHKVLKLFRINSDKNNLIAEIPVLSIVNCMMVNNKYVILGTNDKRILSYLIVDYKNKMHDNRIKELTLQ